MAWASLHRGHCGSTPVSRRRSYRPSKELSGSWPMAGLSFFIAIQTMFNDWCVAYEGSLPHPKKCVSRQFSLQSWRDLQRSLCHCANRPQQ
jgi:hypothetical protein